MTALCTQADLEAPRQKAQIPKPSDEDFNWMVLSAPPMTGAEYLTAEVLSALWDELDAAFWQELASSGTGIQEFLKRRNPAWNLVGRVLFNLAENRQDPQLPFAFLATYTTRLSQHAKVQHLPLGQALREYAGAANNDRLLSLLLPVQRAAEACGWLKAMVDAGEIFHPLRWSPAEAMQMLRDVPQLEAAGVVVRMPAAWRGKRPPRPRVRGSVGGQSPVGVGQEALLDFRMEMTLDGETLTPDEISALLAQSDGLALVRGRWVEIDREQLTKMMERFREIERTAAGNGLSFRDAMRLLAGAAVDNGDTAEENAADWSQVVAGPWLAETLQGLRSPEGLAQIDPGAELNGTLRPYQQVGVRWLYLLSRLGLGACLADDMGLGKTVQVLSLLLVLQRQTGGKRQPSLLVAPASLLANWASEMERFTPGLRALIAHPSALPATGWKALTPERAEDVDLVITSYGSLLRVPWIAERSWRLVVLDEAQAIKNPGARQTHAAKKLKARARLALTGTPVENRLGDLWSIFDFVNPGLLGSAKEFSSYAKRLAERPHVSYGPLRELVRPYILRRLKTDKTVISDLPDKTEMKAFCALSRKQAALYQEGGEGTGRTDRKLERHRAQGTGAGLSDALQTDMQPSFAMARRWRLERRRQRQVRPPAPTGRSHRREAGKGAGIHPVPRDHRSAGGVSGTGVRNAGAGAARRDRSEEAQGTGAALPGRGIRAVLCALAQGRRRGLKPDGRLARGALRPLVESGGGEPGHRPRLPHRPDQKCAGAQIRLQRYGRREGRPIDRIEAPALHQPAGGRRRRDADGIERRRTAQAGRAGPQQSFEGDLTMAFDGWGWRPYVSVAQRRSNAARELAKRQKKGQAVSPVILEGRKIATSFWGKAWCDNLEHYSDFANRLPRGRTYVRNGSVVDLQIAAGRIQALVSGSDIYEVVVKVTPVAKARWKSICEDCAGAIDSLVELLQGKFSKGVMERICRQNAGLFPSPREIALSCSCPDWASMCKHVAAVLYGIGSRFDRQPRSCCSGLHA